MESTRANTAAAKMLASGVRDSNGTWRLKLDSHRNRASRTRVSLGKKSANKLVHHSLDTVQENVRLITFLFIPHQYAR